MSLRSTPLLRGDERTCGEELAERICALAPGAKFFHRLYYRLLAKLYEKYPTKEMLTAVCCLLIKGNVRGKESFRGMKRGSARRSVSRGSMNISSMRFQDSYEQMMPRQVLLYFSYESAHLTRRAGRLSTRTWLPIFLRMIRSIKIRARDGKVCHGAAVRVPDQ